MTFIPSMRMHIIHHIWMQSKCEICVNNITSSFTHASILFEMKVRFYSILMIFYKYTWNIWNSRSVLKVLLCKKRRLFHFKNINVYFKIHNTNQKILSEKRENMFLFRNVERYEILYPSLTYQCYHHVYPSCTASRHDHL